jgi:hypothetical protein
VRIFPSRSFTEFIDNSLRLSGSLLKISGFIFECKISNFLILLPKTVTAKRLSVSERAPTGLGCIAIAEEVQYKKATIENKEHFFIGG